MGTSSLPLTGAALWRYTHSVCIHRPVVLPINNATLIAVAPAASEGLLGFAAILIVKQRREIL